MKKLLHKVHILKMVVGPWLQILNVTVLAVWHFALILPGPVPTQVLIPPRPCFFSVQFDEITKSILVIKLNFGQFSFWGRVSYPDFLEVGGRWIWVFTLSTTRNFSSMARCVFRVGVFFSRVASSPIASTKCLREGCEEEKRVPTSLTGI